MDNDERVKVRDPENVRRSSRGKTTTNQGVEHMSMEEAIMRLARNISKVSMPIDQAINRLARAIEDHNAIIRGDAPVSEGKTPAPEGKTPAPEAKAPAPEEKAPAPEEKAPAPEEKTPAAPLAYRDVQSAVLALAEAKGKTAVIDILASFNVAKAVNLKPEQYEEAIQMFKAAMPVEKE